MKGAWTVRLVAVSEQDYLEIIKRSAQDFGAIQAEVYAEILAMAMNALHLEGPEAIGVKAREEIGHGIFTLHAATHKRKARHFLVFRVLEIQTIEILRILHDRMDLARHLPLVREQTRH
jgi:toxin ParE1/3/4